MGCISTVSGARLRRDGGISMSATKSTLPKNAARPRCTKSWEGVLKRRFHLQDVHCVEFTKDTKRDRPDAAVEDKEVPTATYRGKRRRVNQAGPNTADALLPTMGHHFIDETAEIIQ